MTDLKTNIYILVCPSGFARYVGKTSKPVRARLLQHINRSMSNNSSHIYCWIRKILSSGLKPEIITIETVEGSGSMEERFWISYFRQIGCELTNSTDGGDIGSLGHKKTKEQIDRMRVAITGIKKRPHTRKPLSDETKLKISNANKGKPPPFMTNELRSKLSESAKAAWNKRKQKL